MHSNAGATVCSWRYSIENVTESNKYSIHVNFIQFSLGFYVLALSWSHLLKKNCMYSTTFIRFQWANWNSWWISVFLFMQHYAVKLIQHKLTNHSLEMAWNWFDCCWVFSSMRQYVYISSLSRVTFSFFLPFSVQRQYQRRWLRKIIHIHRFSGQFTKMLVHWLNKPNNRM